MDSVSTWSLTAGSAHRRAGLGAQGLMEPRAGPGHETRRDPCAVSPPRGPGVGGGVPGVSTSGTILGTCLD